MSIIQHIGKEISSAGLRRRSPEAALWFRKRMAELRGINRAELMKDPKLRKEYKPGPGSMMMFYYDPKHKATLPYYDRFPLIIMVDVAPGGFYGLNLHYLSPYARAKFLNDLYDLTSNKRFDESTRFKVSYQMLKQTKKYREFAPCWKHYLTKHVQSSFSVVPASEWDIAVFLPLQKFKGAAAQTVWKESLKKRA